MERDETNVELKVILSCPSCGAVLFERPLTAMDNSGYLLWVLGKMGRVLETAFINHRHAATTPATDPASGP